MRRSKHWLWIILVLIAWKAGAQKGEIRGFVYDKNSGEPVIFTNVYLKGTSIGAATDVNGFYSISRVPAGEHTLISTSIGYDTAEMKVNVKAGQIITKNLYLNETALKIKEVEVVEKRIEQKRKNVEASKIKVTPKQISRIPSFGGTPDLAQYLQVLPGVIFTGDQGGQIYIRGGTPVQNKVLLDGMTIYNPFHSIGLFSVFDMDIVRNIVIYTGGFNAEYGNRVSAVMDIKTRDGNRKEFKGKLTTSPFNSKLLLEGPLKKWKIGEGSISYLLNSRVSYLDKTSPVLYSYADSNGLPYSFADFYGKLSFNSSGGSKASFFGFNFNDKVDFTRTTSYNWTASGGGAEFFLLPSTSSTTIRGSFAYSDYRITQQELDNRPRFSYINGFQAGLDFNNYPGDDHLKYGFDINGFKTQFEYYNAVDRKLEQTQFTTQMAGYLRFKKVLGDLVLDPGFRLHYFASLQELSPEPRLGLKYNLGQYFRLKFAGGWYAQNLFSSRSDRDVVNLFYGFLTSPDDLPDNFDGKTITSRLQRSRHAILGMEWDLGVSSAFNLEGYVKDFNKLIDINRNKIYDDVSEYQDKPDYLRENFIVESGIAYGGDLTFKYDKKPFYLWTVYSLGWVKRHDGRITYPPHWDRRHNFNFLGTYVFGKENSWEASIRWNLGSGFPFTQTQGFYELIDFTREGLNTPLSTNGRLGIEYAKLNGGRLPYYHRLDISLRKHFNFKKGGKLQLAASVINVYDRDNVFYFNRVSHERIDQLPVMPSIVASYSF